MVSRNYSLRRLPGKRRYRRIFYIATEGTITELQYFKLIDGIQDSGVIKFPPGSKKGLEPPKLVEKMAVWIKSLEKERSFTKEDQAWLVFDTDNRNNEHIQAAIDWARKDERYHIAVSNPKFEYWLLLHFGDGNNIGSGNDCDRRLLTFLPNYKKKIDPNKFSISTIKEAINRAGNRNNCGRLDWPKHTGTTVYKLLEQLITDEH